MKRILSLLLCFVFLRSQAFAMTGGPGGLSGGRLNTVGSYAGVMTPVLDPAQAGNPLFQLDVNAIGLFGLKVEQAGFAQGVCAIFNKGEIFTGKMIGVASPNGKLQGVLEARTIRVITATTGAGGGGFFTGSNIVAVGKFDGKIRSAGTGTNSRVSGTALVNSFDDTNRDPATGVPILTGFITLKLDGFKQSDTPQDYPDIDLGVDLNRNQNQPQATP